ncbi:MAG: tRNA lysidine(34) synthetase TilS [Alphaproteobacteria bacterium]
MKDNLKNFLQKNESPVRIALAISGGADSMALAFAASQLKEYSFLALTVDHQLRSDSQTESHQVQKWMTQFKIPHRILVWKNGKNCKNNIEDSARQARYDLLKSEMKKENIELLLTAHHQDDQIETFFLNLKRGSGVKGLSGMRSIREDDSIQIGRPFLDKSKTEILSFCNKNNIPYTNDPMNDDASFSRVKIRKNRSCLEKIGLSDSRILLTMKNLAKTDETLTLLTSQFLDKITLSNSTYLRAPFSEIPVEMGVRALTRLLQDQSKSNYPPSWESVENLYHKICSNLSFKTTLGKCIIVGEKNLTFKKEIRS